jgi:hypothetical protein
MILNNLENAIFDWVKSKFQEPTLSKQIESLELLKREYTGCGFYLTLKVNQSAPVLNEDFFKERVIDGPYIQSSGIEDGGGSLLFIENGFISTLELYANGQRFDKDIHEFLLFTD